MHAAGIEVTRIGDPAHERLSRMRDFYQFLLAELPGLLHRWQQHQRSGRTAGQEERR
ncbi:hypothetical protein [Spongiactinospora rosea]|uniref:hypothetical protein n=1 Tax=Spongiactinospora rosea TaxID=2248750 RepID=UPI0018F3182C|nr:hypothetical protein [Spongiactinospora rosea]